MRKNVGQLPTHEEGKLGEKMKEEGKMRKEEEEVVPGQSGFL